jgi:hypothetical protein
VYVWHSTYDCRTSSTGMSVQDKLYGDAENLELTTNFFKRINVIVLAANAKEQKEVYRDRHPH